MNIELYYNALKDRDTQEIVKKHGKVFYKDIQSFVVENESKRFLKP